MWKKWIKLTLILSMIERARKKERINQTRKRKRSQIKMRGVEKNGSNKVIYTE